MKRVVADLAAAGRPKGCFGRLAAIFLPILLAGCNSLLTAGSPAPVATALGNAATAAPQKPSSDDNAGAEEHARIVAAYGGIYHDDRVEQSVARIVGRVVAASDKPEQSYRITILNAPAVNAFALPGGYLYVTRGLLALANDSSEVAAVLAHEIGHITANHAIERQNKARNALLVSRVVTDVLDDSSGKLALAASQRTLASFSRQQELEADAIGVRTIGKAGYDPYAAARFLNAMARYSSYRANLGVAVDKRPDFLATHPATPERVDFATRAARQFGAPGVGDVDRDRYLQGIDGIVYGDDPSQGYVRDRTFIHPSLGVSFTVPEGFVIDNTSDAVLATGADGTALRFDAVGLPKNSDLGAYLNSGWVNGLTEGSIRTFSVNGMPAASASAKAKGWVFQIAVVQVATGATYRFIFANEQVTPTFTQAAQMTVSSFRKLDPVELAKLKPLRVRVLVASAGDTEDTFVRKMKGVERPRDLFRALNDLPAGSAIPAGTRVKVVNDD
ncbi:MAG: M48 family metalloprotease [Rhizobiales bacterium]|nr:M48 family metalloprotease [Hyphomicrobiales bacterium]